ncbi:MAG: hypothetical protein O7F71_22050 [Gammaproteobacteria bacterium]|nr:hypothetical protein [Gammaproteobacteria bacterium]
MADREFIGGQWIEFLLKNNIMFAIRVKENGTVRLDDGHCYQLKSLLRTRKGGKWLHGRPARLAAMADGSGTPLALHAEPELAQRLAQQAYTLAIRDFTREACAQAFFRLFAQMVQNSEQ